LKKAGYAILSLAINIAWKVKNHISLFQDINPKLSIPRVVKKLIRIEISTSYH